MTSSIGLLASRQVWERAARSLPGGENASARYNRARCHALFVSHG